MIGTGILRLLPLALLMVAPWAPTRAARAQLDVGFTRIAQEGDPLPGVSGSFLALLEIPWTNFTYLAPPAVDQCRVAFAGGTDALRTGIFFHDGSLRHVAGADGVLAPSGWFSMEGTTVAFDDGSSQIRTWDDGSVSVVAQGGVGPLPPSIWAPSIDSGDLAFHGLDMVGINGEDSAWLDTGSGPVLVADENTDIPGHPPGTTFSQVHFPLVDGGIVAFRGQKSDIGPEEPGIYVGSGGPLTRIADTNTTIPDTGATFANVHLWSLEAGKVLFSGSDAASTTGGLFTGDGVSIDPVVRYGDDIPESSRQFEFVQGGDIEGPRIVFAGGVASEPWEMGIYLHDGASLHKIVDTSDTLDGKAPLVFDTGPKSLDGNRVAFSVLFADYSSAVYVATIHGGLKTQIGPPVGTIVGWHEDQTGVPPLVGSGWVRLDGQMLSDSASPYPMNTQLPDLNGTARFLRGGTCSGVEQEDAMQGHWHDVNPPNGGAEHIFSSNVYWQDFNPAFNLATQTSADIVIGDVEEGYHGPVNVADETRPDNMAVTWIMKIYEGAPLPVGSIIGYHRDFTPGTAALLPPGWVEFDDATPLPAPYFNGTDKLPDLNGERRFLRAGPTTGTLQDDALQAHRHDIDTNAHKYVAGTNFGNGDFVQDFQANFDVNDPISDGIHGSIQIDTESRPDNMSVVWMMKVDDTALPPGAILGWHRDLPGTPEGGRGIAVLDGRVLHDASSPFDGETLPDLNDTGRFLRGGATSGLTESHAIQGHHHSLITNQARYVDGSQQVWGLPVVSGFALADDQPAILQPIGATTSPGFSAPRLADETRPINMSVVWVMQTGYPAESVAVGPLSNSLLGGSGTAGGVDFSFPGATPGYFSGTYTLAEDAGAALQNGAFVNFSIPTDPAQLWELQYTESFTAPVTLTFGYDDSNFQPFFAEASLEIYRYVPPFGGCTPGVDCDWLALPKIGQDLAMNTITVTTPGFSQFALGGPLVTDPGEYLLQLQGSAQGGSIDFHIGAVQLSVTTSAGESASEVAANVAAAINGDETLSAAGITATASGAVVQSSAPIHLVQIDPGLLFSAIPALPGWALGLAAATLLLAATWWVPRVARRR